MLLEHCMLRQKQANAAGMWQAPVTSPDRFQNCKHQAPMRWCGCSMLRHDCWMTRGKNCWSGDFGMTAVHAHLRAALAAAEAVSDLEVSESASWLPALAASPVATPAVAPHLAQRAWLSAACLLALIPACFFSHAMLASCSKTDWCQGMHQYKAVTLTT